MKRQKIITAAVALALLVSAAAAADTDRLYIASGDSYVVVDPADGGVLHQGNITGGTDGAGADGEPADTPSIIPTPGGRFVFFHRPWSDTVTVVDAESHRPVRTIDLPQAARTIVFSSMGDEVFLPIADNRFVYLDHRRGEIRGGAQDLRAPAESHPAFNRRATRLYATDSGRGGPKLVYVLKSSGEEIAEVALPAGNYDWQASPNFRYLLGVDNDGDRLVVVTEQARRVTAEIDEDVVPDQAFFSSDSETITALLADRRTALVIDARRGRVRERVQLPERVDYLRADVDGRLLAVSGTTVILDVGGQNRRVDVGRYLDGGGGDAGVRTQLVTLKPGQGFACF